MMIELRSQGWVYIMFVKKKFVERDHSRQKEHIYKGGNTYRKKGLWWAIGREGK